MFEVLCKSLKIGVITTDYPTTAPAVSTRARGKPEIDWPTWSDARPASAVCPTGSISYEDKNNQRIATLDLGKCIFCGLCADADKAIRMTNLCECSARLRQDLVTTANYSLKPDGTHDRLLSAPDNGLATHDAQHAANYLGEQLKTRIHNTFGRSLHIREVDAGSCNGCEIEIVGLNSP